MLRIRGGDVEEREGGGGRGRKGEKEGDGLPIMSQSEERFSGDDNGDD